MSKSKHPRPSRYELTQTQWERIEDLLPGKASDPGRVAVDKRSFVNGVLWVLRSGARWSDLPPRYGAYKSAHKRFTRWAAKGIWEQVFQSLICDRSNEYLMIDSSIVRAHAQAATAKRGGCALGSGALPRRSAHEDPHGGGWPGPSGAIYPHWRAAQRHHASPSAAGRIQAQKYVLADKGYDSRELLAQIQSLDAQPVIPPRSCQQPRAYDKTRYQLRNRIERSFARLKQFRRIATRFDRKPSHFLVFLYLASIPLWVA